MSFFNKQPVPPTRHRPTSSIRSGSSGTTGSSYNNRPRSLGLFSTNSYSSPYSNVSSSSPYSSALNNYNGYSGSYQSPYFPNGYRGATGSSSGYASLTIPASSVLKSFQKKYENGGSSSSNSKDGSSHISRRELNRGNSYRERSVSRSRNSLASSGGMGSRSISLNSLNSEGYVSGTDRSSRSRISSTSDIRNENGEIDYKKLYEQQLVENDRLKEKLRKSDEELRETKQTLEKINLVTSKNSLSELEKRERRAMERKLSEMEEELKNLEHLKSENQRLKDENGALIRVISKLSK